MGLRICLVAAVAENNVIGSGGGMPWRLPSDLRRFKELTMGKPILMGRKTYESIGKPLPGRTNIVLTNSDDFHAEGIRIVHSVVEAMDVAEEAAGKADAEEVMVIGGASLYERLMDRAERLYVTHVAGTPAGDTYFPEIDPEVWSCLTREPMIRGVDDSTGTSFAIYDRIKTDQAAEE
ncbi:dihydrofolate reductase [Rhodobium gokarnense]|uniref:Dihydrofolate reductase n=1 Tax=Rhodobium gokarnense TaxID=364296 RepID=A0ABT3H9C8_9HYPH|nr:dihydrofolate reductase [Rhodobium gokarnense]MCW2307000.1 dihydrofolate reductase [Rhodobium gokarnense]